MKAVIKCIFLLTISLYVFNVLLMWLFGNVSLIEIIIRDTHTSYKEFKWTKDVTVITNRNLSNNQKKVYEDFYSTTNANIRFDKREIDDCIYDKCSYMHIMMFENSFGVPFYKITESESIDDYIHSYKRTYVWVFFKWVKIREEFLGIS